MYRALRCEVLPKGFRHFGEHVRYFCWVSGVEGDGPSRRAIGVELAGEIAAPWM